MEKPIRQLKQQVVVTAKPLQQRIDAKHQNDVKASHCQGDGNW
ncbi:hypothetical protein [Neisseria iguanae]|nr:hypothetical protein [Neisseria iguanae]